MANTSREANANDKLVRLDRVVNDVSRSPVERMELALRIAQEYDQGTDGHPVRVHTARSVVEYP